MRNKNKGFTLIELLIVIAIIGILASVILVSLNVARTKAREANFIAYTAQMEKVVQAVIAGGYLDPTVAYDGCLGNYDFVDGHCYSANTTYPNQADLNAVISKVAQIPEGQLSPYCNYCGVRLLSRIADTYATVFMRVMPGQGDVNITGPICTKIGWAINTNNNLCSKQIPK